MDRRVGHSDSNVRSYANGFPFDRGNEASLSMVSCSGMSDEATFLVSVGPAIQKHVQHACPHTRQSVLFLTQRSLEARSSRRQSHHPR